MLAEQMHGTVECKSLHGHGATFALRLPTAPEEPAVESANAPDTIVTGSF